MAGEEDKDSKIGQEDKDPKVSLGSKAAAGGIATIVVTLFTVFFTNGGADMITKILSIKAPEQPSNNTEKPDGSPLSKKEIDVAYKKALQLEEEAKSQISEANTSEESWNKIIQNWQKAIQFMQQIPLSDVERYPVAQQKVKTYKNQLLYAEALKLGSIAANLTEPAANNTLSQGGWQKNEKLWQQAKEKLNAISTDDPIYAKVDKKLEEYQTKESYAHQAGLVASWLQGIRAAEMAGKLAENANNTGDWIKVSALWSQAIDFMKMVPSENADKYREVPKKISEYQKNLGYSQRKASS